MGDLSHYDICLGCSKSNFKFCCSVYKDPTKTPWIRNGEYCPFNSRDVKSKKKKFVNPIKQSKRKTK